MKTMLAALLVIFSLTGCETLQREFMDDPEVQAITDQINAVIDRKREELKTGLQDALDRAREKLDTNRANALEQLDAYLSDVQAAQQ